MLTCAHPWFPCRKLVKIWGFCVNWWRLTLNKVTSKPVPGQDICYFEMWERNWKSKNLGRQEYCLSLLTLRMLFLGGYLWLMSLLIVAKYSGYLFYPRMYTLYLRDHCSWLSLTSSYEKQLTKSLLLSVSESGVAEDMSVSWSSKDHGLGCLYAFMEIKQPSTIGSNLKLWLTELLFLVLEESVAYKTCCFHIAWAAAKLWY